MKTALYWFSGTGNSLRVARAIQEGLGDAQLVPIAGAADRPEEPAERVGLVFPVYAWGPPAIVERFIEHLPADADTYVFAVMTDASNPGSAPQLTRRLLRERGLELAAAYGVRMPENYPPLGGPPKPEKQQRILARAEERIAEVVADLRGSPRGRIEKRFLLWRALGRLIHPMFRRSMPRADRKFSVDETCNQCGLCAKVCPVGNIELVDGLPRWLGRCEQCYACYHWCPQKAIQRGRRTPGRDRYHHPACKATDLIVGETSSET